MKSKTPDGIIEKISIHNGIGKERMFVTNMRWLTWLKLWKKHHQGGSGGWHGIINPSGGKGGGKKSVSI